MTELHVYVGSYTSNGGEGITVFAFNADTGELRHLRTLVGVINPSYLEIDPTGKFLYAVNEVESYYGKPEGALSAFAVDPADGGSLRFLNQQPSGGASPCHLSLDRMARILFVANYGGGSVASFPVLADGRIGPVATRLQHQGSGPRADRQKSPHAHCMLPDPGNRHVLGVDLGADRIEAYAFDSKYGFLKPAQSPGVSAKPGSGPRHIAFHPGGRWAYVAHELESTVTAFTYDAETAALAPVQTIASLGSEYHGENFPGGILVASNGRFLYVSNRGQDGIAHFSIDAATGKLAFAGSEPTRGKFPRHFAFDPSGRFLLAANLRSDSIRVFRVDETTGALSFTGHGAALPAPACVRFAPRPA